jgi:hypothetical protein
MTAPTAKPSPMILQSIGKRRQSYSRHKIAEFVAAWTINSEVYSASAGSLFAVLERLVSWRAILA